MYSNVSFCPLKGIQLIKDPIYLRIVWLESRYLLLCVIFTHMICNKVLRKDRNYFREARLLMKPSEGVSPYCMFCMEVHTIIYHILFGTLLVFFFEAEEQRPTKALTSKGNRAPIGIQISSSARTTNGVQWSGAN